MHRRTIDESDAKIAPNDENGDVPGVLSDWESRDNDEEAGFRGCSSEQRKSVSFEGQSRDALSPSMLAAAAAAGAAAAASMKNNNNEARKSKKPRVSPLSPSSIATAPTMTSEDSFSPCASPTGTVVTLQHTVKQRKSKWSFLKCVLKPRVIVTLVIIFLLAGGTAYFFNEWLTIPGLNDQIERLEAEVARLGHEVDRLENQVGKLTEEVDRLGGEVDRLAEENDRFAQLNDELEETIGVYEKENEKLQSSLDEFEDLNIQLEGTTEQLHTINEQLQDQNADFALLNQDLNETTSVLIKQVDRLEILAGNLTEQNAELRELNKDLHNHTTSLSALNKDLNETVSVLGEEVVDLASENKRLKELNEDLSIIVSFLNETASGIDETYTQAVEYLSEQITAYRVLVLDTLESLYAQRVSRWDCDFSSFFLTEPFATNHSLAIGNKYSDVLDYVDERVLSELCLSLADFERYLQARQNGELTTNQLVNSVTSYTTRALDYYFPNDGDAGVSSLAWSEAGYQCENLPSELAYRSS